MILLIGGREEDEEGGRGGSAKEKGREREALIASHTQLWLGTEPQPLGIWDDAPINWAPSQGYFYDFGKW